MIIGRGILANAFKKQIDMGFSGTIFASGVSNSLETKNYEFERESQLLMTYLDHDLPLVYFSTCSLYDVQTKLTPYREHKLKLERLVLSCADNYVFRLPQVVGNGGNPLTLTNYLYQKIISEEHFLVQKNAFRNLIDVDDCVKICLKIMSDASFPPSIYSVKNTYDIAIIDLVAILEEVLKKKANYSMTIETSNFTHKSRVSDLTAERLSLDFGNHYTIKLIEKYYA